MRSSSATTRLTSARWSLTESAEADGTARAPMRRATAVPDAQRKRRERRMTGRKPTNYYGCVAKRPRQSPQPTGSSFPLDRSGRLRCDVVGDSVDAFDLIDDSAGHPLEEVVRQPRPIRRHGVVARDGPDDDRPRVSAFVAHHTDGANVGEHRERLPDLSLEAGEADLLADDGVGLLQDADQLWRHLTDNADAEPGPGERLAPHDLVGKVELRTESAHLVLEQTAQRFDELERHVLGQSADVVMALDDVGSAIAAAALDDVGIQRALHEERGVGETPRVLLEDAYEQLADRLALLLRLGDAGERFEEPVSGVDVDQLDAHVAPERLDDLLALALAHQPRVDVDARQLRADRAVHECSGDGGVDSAGQTADDAIRSDHLADVGDLVVDDRVHRPCRPAGGEIDHESAQDLHAVRRVDDFRMELDAPDLAVRIFERGHRRVGGGGRRHEALRHLDDGVEVAHPDVLLMGQRGQQLTLVVGHRQPCPAILAAHTSADLTAELLSDQLGAVADPEDRDAELVDRRVERWRTLHVHALRTAGQDDRRRLAQRQVGSGDAMRDDLAVHVELADSTGDELGVLGAEVDDEHRVAVGVETLGQAIESSARWVRHPGKRDDGDVRRILVLVIAAALFAVPGRASAAPGDAGSSTANDASAVTTTTID